MADPGGGGGLARVLILGAGVFGRLAAEALRADGHEPVAVHRHGRLRTDANDAASVMATARTVRAEALLVTAGPAASLQPGAARAAAELGIPYVDIAEEGAYHQRVLAVPSGVPLLTGMSTTPAVAEALAALALRRARKPAAVRATLYGQAGNARGRATLDFAVASRLRAPSVAVDLPGFGVPAVHPARAAFAPAGGLPAAFFVGFSGLAGLGWRLARLPGVRTLGRLLPPIGGTGGLLAVDVLDSGGRVLVREGLSSRTASQRMAVLPATWALAEALAGRAPTHAVLPHEWVDPDLLVKALEAGGFQRLPDL